MSTEDLISKCVGGCTEDILEELYSDRAHQEGVTYNLLSDLQRADLPFRYEDINITEDVVTIAMSKEILEDDLLPYVHAVIETYEHVFPEYKFLLGEVK